MSQVRVTPWQDEDPAPPELVQAIRVRRPDGELLDLDRVLLKSFPLAIGWNALFGQLRAQFALDPQYRELIMCRVAVLNGADYEWSQHKPVYLAAGGTEAKCDALRRAGIDPIFDEAERALLMLTDQSTRRVEVDAGVIETLKAMLGEPCTVEAVAVVAAYNMVSRFLVALGI